MDLKGDKFDQDKSEQEKVDKPEVEKVDEKVDELTEKTDEETGTCTSQPSTSGKWNDEEISTGPDLLSVNDPLRKFRKRVEKLPKGIGICRRCCCHLRLAICCIMASVTMIIISLFIVTFSVSLDSTLNNMMSQLRDEDFSKSFFKINEHFSDCEKSALMVQNAFDSGAVNINDDKSIGVFFHSLLDEQVESIDSFYIGFPNKKFVYVSRNGGGSCPRSGYSTMNGTHIEGFCIDEDLSAASQYTSTTGYDCTGRPWYVDALALRNETKVRWSDIYVSTGGEVVFYTISLVVEDTSGNLIGIFAIDMTGESISETVQEVDVGKGGRLVVMEEDGKLVSVSVKNHSLIDLDSPNLDRVHATDSDDEIVAAIGEEVESNDNFNRKFRKRVGSKNMFMEIGTFNSDLNDKNWILAMALDRSDFDRAAITTIWVVSVTVSVFVLMVICCMNCLTCCLFNRVQQLSKKMKRISELEFHKVKVSRLHMFSEIASIELSFYKMAKMMLEYRAFLPDYLKEEEESRKGKKGIEEEYKLSDTMKVNDNSCTSEGHSNDDDESSSRGSDYHQRKKSVNSEFELQENVQRGSTADSLSSCASDMSIGSDHFFLQRKSKDLLKTSMNQDTRPLTLVIVTFRKECVAMKGQGLIDLFQNMLPKMEALANRFRGIIISFTEQEVQVGFNCASKQTMWKGHLARGVEFAVEARQALSSIYSLDFRIGLSRGVSTIHTFGSQKNRVRKVVGNVEKIAKNLSLIGPEWNTINLDFREANELPRLVICKPKELVVMPKLMDRRGKGSYFFVCQIEGILKKEINCNQEWMYVREKEEKMKSMNFHMDMLKKIVKNQSLSKEEVDMLEKNEGFMKDLWTNMKENDTELFGCLESKKNETDERFKLWNRGKNVEPLEYYYIF